METHPQNHDPENLDQEEHCEPGEQDKSNLDRKSMNSERGSKM